MEVFEELTEKYCTKTTLPVMKAILKSEGFFSTMELVMKMQMPCPNQVGNCMISTSGEHKIDKLINKIKQKILKVYGTTLHFLLRETNSMAQLNK